MTHAPHPDHDTDSPHADLAALSGWVLALGAVLADWLEHTLPRAWLLCVRRFVRELGSDLRMLVVRIAFDHWAICERRGRGARPAGAPRGFRLVRPDAIAMRALMRVVRLRRTPRNASLAARVRQLRDVLRRVDIWVARLNVRLAKLRLCARLVAAAPPATALRTRAFDAPGYADSS